MNNNYTILLVDDESDILEFLGYNLRREGFQVFESNNGKDAINMTQILNPHLILLDIMMEGMDGLEICKEIKKLKLTNKPFIIFLSAKSEEYLQSATLYAKADDYMTKPIKPQILIKCIKEILNQNSKTISDDNLLEIDNLQINKLSNIVTKDNQKFLLTKNQIDILFLLASSPNKIFKKEEIFAKVWGEDWNCSEIFIDEYIRKINKKIGIENIKAVNGDGFKFEIL